MAINLHLKYAKQLAQAFAKPSYLTGKADETYDFIGVQTIRVPTIITQPMGDYTRSGTSRYGTPAELQDTYQEMKLTQDKSFSITVDKGNNIEQDLMKNAGVVLSAQLREQAVPSADKYALAQWIKYAGKVAGIAEPTNSTVIGLVLEGLTAMDDALVPDDDRMIWIASKYYNAMRKATEFAALDSIGSQNLGRGIIGTLAGVPITKTPISYLPANCYFLITHKNAILHPKQLWDTKLHEDPPGISGSLIEGRAIYDAFVVGAKAMGVYAGVATAQVQATPAITDDGNHKFTATSANAASISYTTDGSDPRYSTTALSTTSGAQVTLAAGATVKAVAWADGTNKLFTSAVGTQTVA